MSASSRGVGRRGFIRLGVLGAFVASGCSSGGRPSLPEEGVVLGTPDEVRRRIDEGGGAYLEPEARAWIVAVPEDDRAALAAAWDPVLGAGISAGFLALSERCPHQGCRVSFCDGSGWFECPCHGSHFTPAGERRQGPAEEGLRAFAIAVESDRLVLRGSAVDALDGDVDVTGAPDPGGHCFG